MKHINATIMTIKYFVPFIALMFLFACTNPISQANSESGSGGGESYSLTANPDTFEVIAGRVGVVPISNMLVNDSYGGDTLDLSVSSVGNTVRGTAEIDGANISFTSTGSAGEAASFEYTVGDGNGLQATSTVTMTVVAVPPVIANADTYEVVQGAQLLVVASALDDNDEDGEGHPLTVVSIANAVGGTAEKSGDNITFTSTGYAGEPAGFEYIVQNDQDPPGTATGNVYITVTPLTPIEAYIYHDSNLLDAKLGDYQPPSVQDIFDSWGRFDGNNFYENKDAEGISSNAAAWQFLIDPDRVSMPLNVSPYNGFVSPDKLENYTLEATLSSTNSDNDTIGLVIAFVREGGINYSLIAVRNTGGTYPTVGWGVCYMENSGGYSYSSATWLIDSKSVGGASGSWGGKQTRVKIVRNGDSVKAYTTNWNDVNTYQASSEIVVDLDSDARLSKFKGAQSYGYMTFSQPDSTYLDVQMGGGLDASKIYNANNAQAWEYIQGSGWTLLATTVQQELGFVREVTNPETGLTYLIRQSSITLQ